MVIWRKIAALIAFATLVSLAGLEGCGSRGGSTEDTATAEAALNGTIICGYSAGTDDNGNPTQEPEYYILSAMNRKISYFPEFASAIGMKSVTDCDGARRFFDAYADYYAAHPGFDNDLRSLPVPDMTGLVQQAAKNHPPPDVTKIYNGVPSGLSPVVKIEFKTDPNTPYWDNSGFLPTYSSCSGVFIAKNWIATAAHCVYKASMQFKPDATNAWGSIATYQWTISWVDSTGNITRTLGANNPLNVLSIADPDFVGFINSKKEVLGLPGAKTAVNEAGRGPFATPHDFALMYLDPFEYDGHLPFDTTATPNLLSQITAVYVSNIMPDPSWTLVDYGFAGSSMQMSGTISSDIQTDPYISETNPSSGSFTFATGCHGDSGGGLLRFINGGPALALVGNNSAHTLYMDADTTCASFPDQETRWVRTDLEVPFIQETLQTFDGPTFQCAPPNVTPAPDGTYLQCWGSPCFTNCDCPSTAFCNNPAVLDPNSPYQVGTDSCDVCPDGTCNCIIGQCLPRPTDFAGNDVSDAATCEAAF